MPDPRPMASSMRFGQYDDPPASESRTRRNRLNQALRATADMAVSNFTGLNARSQLSPPRRSYLDPLQRRRQRSPESEPRDTSAGSGDELRRRRPKRRRLDADLRAPLQPIKYGHYGQVQAGKLSLDIISCDGGEHTDPRHPSTYLGSQNLLRHDKSVYCSERPSSGIVLRHADDTPFCLDKLHIVGPEHGFTAPVREGLVYVAMSLNSLSKYMDPPRYARQHGIHAPPYQRSRSFRPPSEQISLADALRDPQVGAALDAREHRDYARRGELASYGFEERDYGLEELEPPCELTAPGENPDILIATESGNLPIAHLSDEEPGPEEVSSQDVLDFRLQRLQRMRRRFDLNGDDREERWTRSREPRDGNEGEQDESWSLRRIDAMMARSRMADSPQREDGLDDPERNNYYAYPDVPGTSSYHQLHERGSDDFEYCDDGFNDPNVTRARFYVRRGKYKVAIKFDPPVSGRFILLKLWAHRSNVDVQSVIAKGYGGLRFFPAINLR